MDWSAPNLLGAIFGFIVEELFVSCWTICREGLNFMTLSGCKTDRLNKWHLSKRALQLERKTRTPTMSPVASVAFLNFGPYEVLAPPQSVHTTCNHSVTRSDKGRGNVAVHMSKAWWLIYQSKRDERAFSHHRLQPTSCGMIMSTSANAG